MNTLNLVKEFHEKFHHDINTRPFLENLNLSFLRINLLREELAELSDALIRKNPTDVLDALTDIQYVLDGAYLSLGFSDFKYPAFLEVHRANMSKLGLDGNPIRRADGKVLKGPNYLPPNLSQFLK